MQMFAAARSGLARALAAPRVLLVVWLANLLVAAPAAVVMGESIRASIGKSQVSESLLEGYDMGWHGEYKHAARGLEQTLRPSRLSTGGWLDNLDLWWNGEIFRQSPELLALGALFALAWLFLLGGILTQYQRNSSPFVSVDFARDGARFFFRFFRLAALSAPLYYGIFRFARWLFPRLERANQDVTSERAVLGSNLLGALLVLALVVVVKLVFDYAKILMVSEERRSALASAARGLLFVTRRPVSTLGIVVLFAFLGSGLLVLYSWLTPGVGQASMWAVLGAFVVGQAFLMAKLFLRLSLLGAEMAFFEDS